MTWRYMALAGILVLSHWISSASAVEIETLVMPGKVIAGHAETEAECSACHTAFEREKQRIQCMECHEEVAADIDGRSGYHGRDTEAREKDCASCHTDHLGRDADVIGLDPEKFDHALTDFELKGVHGETDCGDCHATDELFRAAPSACFDCHQEDDVHEGGLGRECETCHTPVDWNETLFDHEGETGFALTGGHEQVECVGCHVDDVYENTPTTCYGCHEADDSHDGLNGIECEACHDSGRWPDHNFVHAVQTDFELTGKHAEIACVDCHTGPVFEVSLGSACIDCHLEDDEHDGINGQECGDCHTTRAWTAVSFDHSQETGFALLGAHAELECAGCHTVPVHEASPPADCFGCHEDDDPHAGQLGESCGQCHGETSWTQSVAFDHDLTSFPLIGVHRDAECAGCHEDAQFRDASDQCVDCHREDDVHKMSLGPACGDCHNPVDWALWEFDHNLQTNFEIDGGHVRLECAACHRRPADAGIALDTRCIGCHRSDDVHRGEFGNDCERCHTTTDFRTVERIQ